MKKIKTKKMDHNNETEAFVVATTTNASVSLL